MKELGNSMKAAAGIVDELSRAFGSLFEVSDLEQVSTFYSMPMFVSDAAIEIEKQKYIAGIIPLPRHLRAWHVARKYKALKHDN